MKEFGPAMRDSLVRAGVPRARVTLNHGVGMADWNRPTSQVDLVALDAGGSPCLAAELKAWDIGHQLFDLAKACCLLAAGIPAVFLICVAKQDADFARLPGGELFPAVEGEARSHHFVSLIEGHRHEWGSHAGTGGPEPTQIPTAVATTACSAPVAFEAYPGHSGRAVEVTIVDITPVRLEGGWPEQLIEPG